MFIAHHKTGAYHVAKPMKHALTFAFLVLSSAAALAQAGADGQGAAGGSGVAARVERLEEQIVDLQGIVAAVETLSKSGGGGASAGYSGGGGGGISESQFRQLSEQLADLTQRLERLEARFGMTNPGEGRRNFGSAAPDRGYSSDAPADTGATSYSASRLPPASSDSSGGFGTAIVPQGSGPRGAAAPSADDSPGSVFASSERDGGVSSGRDSYSSRGGGASSARDSQMATAAVTSGPARALYDQAYGALQRREYRAAETYFEQFVSQFPSDALAGEAHFYLGESAYQSAEYRSAADRFLKAYSEHPSSDKAPEALLKLAMSLRRLGENSAACDSFSELSRRYPDAAANVKQRAETEKRRANCA